MKKARLWAIPFVLIATGLMIVDLRSATAARTRLWPSNSCSSTSPCLTEQNTGTGDGIDAATSGVGAGAIGVTTATNPFSGIFGTDSGTSTANIGVLGYSSNGIGVMGTSSNGIGVNAQAGTGATAVLALDVNGGSEAILGDLAIGAYGVSSGITLEGANTTSSSSDAVLVNTKFSVGNAIQALNSKNQSVFSIGNGGAFVANNMTVNGSYSTSENFSVCNTCTGLIPIVVQGTAAGIVANQDQPSASQTAAIGASAIADSQSFTFLGATSQGQKVFTVDGLGDVQANAFITGFAVGRQATVSGGDVATYTVEAGEETLEDGGSAQLASGRAHVSFDPQLIAALDGAANYAVFLTADGPSHPLYVSNQSIGGFDVVESRGGLSSVRFSYRIVDGTQRPGEVGQP